MKIEIGCEKAKFDSQMRIVCSQVKGLCGHQRFKPCKGWYVLTEGAKDCPVRKVEK